MPQFEVIRDVGLSLSALLEAEAKKQKSKAKILLAAPTRELLEKQDSALFLYLYEVRENLALPNKDPWEKDIEGPDGKKVTVIVPPALELELHFMLTAVAEEPGAEYALLGMGMKAFHENPVIKRKDLKGDHFLPTDDLPLVFDDKFQLERAAAVFSALGAPYRTAVGYRTYCRIFGDVFTYPAKPVKVRDITVYDSLHPPEGIKPPPPGLARGPMPARPQPYGGDFPGAQPPKSKAKGK